LGAKRKLIIASSKTDPSTSTRAQRDGELCFFVLIGVANKEEAI
jgi:hypothetical protein